MKRMTKRITALIIAAIMLASMIPAAAAETVTPDYEFKLKRASHTTSTNNLFDASGVAQALVNETVDGDNWGCVNAWKRQAAKAQASNLSCTYNPKYGYIYDPEKKIYPVFLALEIVIGQPGTYTPSLEWVADNNSPYVELYLVKAPTDEEEVAAWTTTYINSQSEELKAKCYKTLSGVSPLGTVKMQPTNLEGDPGDVSGNVALSTVTIAKNDVGSYYLVFVPNGANSTAVANYAAHSSSNNQWVKIQPSSFSLTRDTDDPIAEAFEVTEAPTGYTAPTAIGLTKDETEIETTDNEDGTFDLTAPETNSKEEKFLYWALGLTGNKRIVSFEKTLENYVPAEEGRNYLIAVYEGDVDANKVEYYNQNGQLIPNATEDETVSMPGYGSTSKWKKYSDNIYVADYEKTEADRDEVTVTVVGGTGGETVAFGTEVTCTAAEKDESGNPFKCWKKSGLDGDEIVSVDKTYTFKAWETCTVTAEYEKHVYFGNNMKIIIDDFAAGDETGVMAEFIGLDNAVEKGIMFTDSEENETKIAMTTKDSQFTVVADKPGTYVGYAILKSSDAYTLITDGSYSKSAE